MSRPTSLSRGPGSGGGPEGDWREERKGGACRGTGRRPARRGSLRYGPMTIGTKSSGTWTGGHSGTRAPASRPRTAPAAGPAGPTPQNPHLSVAPRAGATPRGPAGLTSPRCPSTSTELGLPGCPGPWSAGGSTGSVLTGSGVDDGLGREGSGEAGAGAGGATGHPGASSSGRTPPRSPWTSPCQSRRS